MMMVVVVVEGRETIRGRSGPGAGPALDKRAEGWVVTADGGTVLLVLRPGVAGRVEIGLQK